MGEERIQKMEIDYSSTVDEKIPAAEALAAKGKLNDAIDMLLSIEKQTRSASDAISTGRLLVCIIQLCYKAKNYEALNEYLNVLCKKRSQSKQAVTKMVQEACTYTTEIQDKALKLQLIDTLRGVTAGKIYVEVERARLSRQLAEIKEADNDVAAAADVLQELQVETFGSMEKREKVEFILEQMRLCLARQDYIRTQIINKKINPKFFATEKNVDGLRRKYYNLMISLHSHEKNYLSISKHHAAILQCAEAGSAEFRHHLQALVLFLLLAPHGNEQHDLLQRTVRFHTRALESEPLYQQLSTLFLTMELISFQEVSSNYLPTLKTDLPQLTSQEFDALQERVTEHNIRVLAAYYTKLSVNRASQLLALSHEQTEKAVSAQVVAGAVTAKIDRLAGQIHFVSSQTPTEVLNAWSHNISAVMRLVEDTVHLINKERMVHQPA